MTEQAQNSEPQTPVEPQAPQEPQNTPQETPQGESPEPKVYDEAYVKSLREEAARHRLAAKTAADNASTAERDRLLKLLGGTQEQTPEEALKQVATERDHAAQARVDLARENAIIRAAMRERLDVDTVLDSRSFTTQIADLDIEAKDFSAQVAEALKNAADSGRFTRQAQVVGRSTNDQANGSPEVDHSMEAINKRLLDKGSF